MAYWPLINRLACRRFPRSELAEEAALAVMDALARDDWRRLRAFSGRSSHATFMSALTLNLLEDFARRRFGRIRPPLWVRRLGGLWLTLFGLLCLERYPPAEAVALAGRLANTAVAAAEEAAYRILAEIPSCGERRGEEVPFDEEAILHASDTDCSVQERNLEEEERERLFTVLGRILFDGEQTAMDPQLLARIARIGDNLAPEERLLLKLCFRDGVAVTEAGRMLDLNRHQVHGRLRRILARLREELATAGLAEELRLLL